jgi:hypothetical protein
VTRDSDRLPPGCSPGEVADALLRFFDAFNRGDQPQLARFFEPTFEWYSVTGGADGQADHFTTGSRDALLAYFAKRHERRERLRLRALVVGGSWGSAGVTYTLTRDADDLAPWLGGPERAAAGKGELRCPGRQIFVWSMGMDDTPRQVRVPCPAPPAGTPPEAVVACARE